MYKLKFSNFIYEDIESSVSYIKNDLQNTIAAQKLKKEIQKAYKKIKLTPLIYPLVPVEKLANKGFRFILVKNYMLFFRAKTEEKIINIERFLYGPRDWANILGDIET